tara:strand:- start:106 stop:450 length:345 start_codon:yes stop_codon:yes gene_type:complete
LRACLVAIEFLTPKLHTKTKALDGKGQVLCDERGPFIWLYTERNGKGEYRRQQLNTANAVDTCVEPLGVTTRERQQENKAQPSRKASEGKEARRMGWMDWGWDHEHKEDQKHLI